MIKFTHGNLKEGLRKLIRRQTMQEKIETVLGKIRPHLQADGGDVELVEVNDGVVRVKLTGACNGCPMASMTLRHGIERILKEELPEVKEVVAV
jgi:Fe-S cluster biogenesis protein NfuA